jgi:hypothetical protein
MIQFSTKLPSDLALAPWRLPARDSGGRANAYGTVSAAVLDSVFE